MQEDEVALVVLAVLTLMVCGGLGVLWLAMTNRRAVREMEHRERLALIQRGLVPAPEADPLGFEAGTTGVLASGDRRSERWRTAGITFIGLGFALMMLLSFTAREPGVGIGLGGAFAVLGVALLVNGTQLGRAHEAGRYRSTVVGPLRSPSPPPTDPPSNIAP